MWSRELITALWSVGTKLHLNAQVQRTIRILGIQCLRRGCRAGRHVRLRSDRPAATETITSGNSRVEAGHYRPIITTCRHEEQYVRRRRLRTPTLQRLTTVNYTATATVYARIPILPAASSLYTVSGKKETI